MTTFTLDTSGAVASHPYPSKDIISHTRWTDLTPFQQGYIEALLRELDARRWAAYRASCVASPGRHLPVPLHPKFDWLHSDALALILRDCEALTSAPYGYGQTASVGGYCWRLRQARWDSPETLNGPLPDAAALCQRFPPLTVSLSDEGKVELKVAV